ncbi:MAG TPA: hypothetical protein PLO05_09495 [Bacteroidales bacterium]|jgi:hypothetical protein|nr:hypothetical protein [Bacteroidales bacterium]MDD4235184.1 hypothetical protein [Bacteroidales bacterium]MDY0160791.1 hypothetical protein [Bacteroidales bacterium]HXK82379.1 hypothetical protein [Bacteroidales bacterium]
MKSLTLILMIIGLTFVFEHAHAQFGYSNEYDTKEGVNIKYKYARSKFLNKESNINLRLRLENTTDEDFLVKFSIVYEKGLTQKLKSEIINIEIPANKSRTGKARGLNFDTGTNDMDYINSYEFNWDFDIFEVSKIKE